MGFLVAVAVGFWHSDCEVFRRLLDNIRDVVLNIGAGTVDNWGDPSRVNNWGDPPRVQQFSKTFLLKKPPKATKSIKKISIMDLIYPLKYTS